MIKTIIKFAIVVVLANGIWRVGSAYTSYYRFRDAVAEVALRSKGMTDDQLKDKVMALAAEYDEPIADDAIAVERDERHTAIEASYVKPISVLPGYDYQWPFSLNVDTLVITPVRPRDLANPQ
jgi:hypothetical protein